MDCPLLGSSNLHSIVKHTAGARKRRCTETTTNWLWVKLYVHPQYQQDISKNVPRFPTSQSVLFLVCLDFSLPSHFNVVILWVFMPWVMIIFLPSSSSFLWCCAIATRYKLCRNAHSNRPTCPRVPQAASGIQELTQQPSAIRLHQSPRGSQDTRSKMV